jgi:hypothetical protein
MFMVVLPRSSIHKIEGAVHPVYVAEIDTAKPKLCENTCQQRTNASLRLHTKIKWFDLPSPKNIDIGAIKEKNRHVWKGMLGSPRGGFFCTCRGPHRRSVEGLKGESSVEESLKEAELKSLCQNLWPSHPRVLPPCKIRM